MNENGSVQTGEKRVDSNSVDCPAEWVSQPHQEPIGGSEGQRHNEDTHANHGLESRNCRKEVGGTDHQDKGIAEDYQNHHQIHDNQHQIHVGVGIVSDEQV